MRSKRQLKEEIQSAADLTSVVEVMKQVAATHLHHLEKHQVRFDSFSLALQEFFYWLNVKEVDHPFFKSKVPARLIVFITSDAGFLGGLNTAVIDVGLSHFKADRGDGMAVIGDRGKNFLLDLGFKLEAAFPGISTNIERDEIRNVKQWVVEKVEEGRYGAVTVTYPHYYSITRQGVKEFELFPCTALPHAAKEAWPFSGSRQVPRQVSAIPLEEQFLLESPLADIIAYLTELWTSERLYTLFWHSKLSELAARTLHLEESFQELGTEKRRLSHLYSRVVHEETDRNIREISSARSQMVKKKADSV